VDWALAIKGNNKAAANKSFFMMLDFGGWANLQSNL